MVTGLWKPIQYVRDIATIQGRLIDLQIRFDDQAQENILFGSMKYFGLSDEFVDKARKDLNNQKKDLEARNFFKKKEEDDDDDEEEEED